MSWSLLRAPVILATALGYVITITPPVPPARSEEQNRYEGLDAVTRIFQGLNATKIIVGGAQTTVTIVACIDALFTLAHAFRSKPFSATILHFLSRNQAAPAVSSGLVLGALVVGVGAYIRKRCYRELGKLFTYELSIRNGHKLVSSGPYAIVRHPSYTGLALLYTGLTTSALSRGSWFTEAGIFQTVGGKVLSTYWVTLLLAISMVIARAGREDQMLQKEFGKEWEAYARRVPYRFIPGLL